MKICHAYPFFSIEHFGGTSDWMYKLVKAQAEHGLKPVILCGDYLFDHKLAATIPDVEFVILPSKLDKQGFSYMPDLSQWCEDNLKDFDIVHMHVFRTYQNAILYKYCKKYDIPYLVDAHGAVPYFTRKPVLKRLYDKFIGKKMLREANFVIAETKYGVKDYTEIEPNIPEGRLIIQPCPYDTAEFKNLPNKGIFKAKYNLPDDKKILMFLGRVNEIKGNDILIEGFAELQKQRDDSLLVIVGSDDGHMEFCKSLVSKLGLDDKVLFTGFLGGEDKLKALVDADIVFQMSRYEQGAWAPIEAVLAGTPIIVSEHTGSGEDIRRLKAGYTAEFGNNTDLAGKINYVLENYDEALDLTHKAADLIEEKYSINACISDITKIYQEAKKQ